MNMKTYALATLGCKVNQYESETIKEQMSGMRLVEFGQPADLYIINCCGVTAEAAAKTRQLVSRARRSSLDALVVLAGCWDDAERSRLRDLGVDHFFTNSEKGGIAKRLAIESKQSRTPPHGSNTRARFFLKVQDGCDAGCAYCAIPAFRGTLNSRPVGEIVDEINTQTARGAREIVLTGIHLGKYGVDLLGKPLLIELIQTILGDTDVLRVRLSSIEPQEITGRLIEMIAGDQRLARHLHVPVQSGSENILKMMRRSYSPELILGLADRIRSVVPEIGLTTDIMVGFPGESSKDFQLTIDVIKAVSFSRLHVFKYSPRPGTPAATLSGAVDPDTKKERARQTRQLGRELAQIFAGSFVGRTLSVLVERELDNQPIGLTSEYVRVKFDQPITAGETLVQAVAKKAEDGILTAGTEIDG